MSERVAKRKKRKRDYAKEYAQRLKKAVREGRTIQSARGHASIKKGARPREKRARTFRPGRAAKQIFGPNPAATHVQYRTFVSKGAASAEVVFPLDRYDEQKLSPRWRRVRSYLAGVPRSLIDESRLVFRLGGQFSRYEHDAEHRYGTTSYEFYFDWEAFMQAYTEAQQVMVDGLVLDVHFATFL